jgi:hypothetical protein
MKQDKETGTAVNKKLRERGVFCLKITISCLSSLPQPLVQPLSSFLLP